MYKIIAVILLIVIYFNGNCQCDAVMKLTLQNYRNPKDVKHNGDKCEIFHIWDSCDPMFHICVTWKKQCDIYNGYATKWKNRRIVYSVFSKEFRIPRKPDSLNVKVTIYDEESHGAHELIGILQHTFTNISPKYQYNSIMYPKQSSINIRMEAQVEIHCSNNYYGPYCTTHCEPEPGVYYCDDKTGDKTCSLMCPFNRQCGRNPEPGQYYLCVCKPEYEGPYCTPKIKKTTNKIGQLTTSLLIKTKSVPTTKSIPTTKTTKLSSTKQVTTQRSTSIKTPSTYTITIKPTNFSTISIRPNIKTESSNDKNHSSEKTHESKSNTESHQATISYTSIIIIVLLILLCIFMISMIYVIHNWHSKHIKGHTFYPSHNARPLPPVIYTPSNGDGTNSINTLSRYSACPSIVSSTYPLNNMFDAYSEASVYNCEYSTPFIKNDPMDTVNSKDGTIYEEPLIENDADFTCQTEITANSNNSDKMDNEEDADPDDHYYEQPISRF